MKKFTVDVHVVYIVDLEAANAEEAEIKAHDLFRIGSMGSFESADVDHVEAYETDEPVEKPAPVPPPSPILSSEISP